MGQQGMARKKVKTPSISIIIPAYNEAEALPVVIAETNKVLHQYEGYEIIVVDDGSTDSTMETIAKLQKKYPCLQYISLSRNFGHQSALRAGLNYARGDAVISMDADLQHPPSLLPQLINKWQQGYDVVYTVRRENEYQSLLKKKTSAWFYKIFRFLSGLKLESGTADFRLLDRKVMDVLRKTPEKNLFLRGYISWLGFRQIALPYEPGNRVAGKSHYSLAKMVKLAVEGIISFSLRPLRLAIYLGLAVVFLGLVYSFYVLYGNWFSDGNASGWTSLMMVMLILGGCQLFIMGILGEYIGTIFMESKKRPSYVIRESSLSKPKEE